MENKLKSNSDNFSEVEILALLEKNLSLEEISAQLNVSIDRLTQIVNDFRRWQNAENN